MKLFAELYLDEDVDVLLVRLVRARGLAAQTTLEADNLGATDTEQLAYASAQGLVMLTHNRGDFENLHRQWEAEERPHAGILVAVRRPPYEIATRRLQRRAVPAELVERDAEHFGDAGQGAGHRSRRWRGCS